MRIISDGSGTQFDPDLTGIFVSLSLSIKEISRTEKNEAL